MPARNTGRVARAGMASRSCFRAEAKSEAAPIRGGFQDHELASWGVRSRHRTPELIMLPPSWRARMGYRPAAPERLIRSLALSPGLLRGRNYGAAQGSMRLIQLATLASPAL